METMLFVKSHGQPVAAIGGGATRLGYVTGQVG